MKRILIFTAIERAFYSSVIEYQLLEPVIENQKLKLKNQKCIYVGFIPFTFWISRKRPVQDFKTFRQNRVKIKKWLKENNVPCYFIPTMFPLRHNNFYLNIPNLVLYVITNLPILLFFLAIYRTNLIHSRNYPAGLLACFANKRFGIPYIFDMRDLYPEKGIEAGRFKKNSWSYKMWKFMERQIIKNALYVIVTSEPFRQYISSQFKISSVLGHRVKVQMFPNCVNTSRFRPDEGKRNNLREKYGISNKFVLVHSGSFGTLVDMPMTLKYFLHFKELKSNVILVILQGMKERLPQIKKVAREVGIMEKDIILLSPEPSEVPELLLLGDVGLHLESMAIATPYCIAVKDGEYLASGLPVIVTPYLRGIAPLIQKYSAGIVIDPLSPDKNEEIRLLDNYKEMRENGFRLVRECLALDKNIEKLADIYKC